MRTNQEVTTPYGAGVIQGRWGEHEYLVRLPVNDTTRAHLSESWTPHATCSGLWVISEKQIKAAA